MKFISLCLPLLIPCFFLTFARGEDVTISQGNVSIQVPAPEGYTVLDKTSDVFKQFKAQKQSTGVEVFAVFFRAAGAGGEDDYTRTMDISVNKKVRGADVTKADLVTMRRTMDGHPDQVLEGAKKASGFSGLVMEPSHDSADRYFSFLTRIRTEDGEQECTVGTPAVVRGRMWTFCVRSNNKATPEEIAWLKSTAKSWTASIIAANPSDAPTLAKEERTGKGVFDGSGKSDAYITGQIVGVLLVVGFVIFLVKKISKGASQT